MEQKKDICPYCGCEETVTGKHFGQGAVVAKDAMTGIFAIPLYHIVCQKCGTVIRSYVLDPKKLR